MTKYMIKEMWCNSACQKWQTLREISLNSAFTLTRPFSIFLWLFYLLKKTYKTHFLVFDFAFEQLDTSDWTVKCADLQKTDSCPLASSYFLHSLKMVCVAFYSSTFTSCMPPHSAVLTTTLLTQNKCSKDSDKILLTACASHSSTYKSNMLSLSSSLAVNSAHVLIEVNKSTWNKSTRNRTTINFCLVLASLGKFKKS